MQANELLERRHALVAVTLERNLLTQQAAETHGIGSNLFNSALAQQSEASQSVVEVDLQIRAMISDLAEEAETNSETKALVAELLATVSGNGAS